MVCSLYTWSSYRHYLVSTLIDRFLITESTQQKFACASSKRLERPISDHYTIILSIWMDKWGLTPFRFENMWLMHKDFNSIVDYWWKNIPLHGRLGRNVIVKLKGLKEVLKL